MPQELGEIRGSQIKLKANKIKCWIISILAVITRNNFFRLMMVFQFYKIGQI